MTQKLKRSEAKGLGLKQYFTGKVCKHGHIAKRNTISGTCVECQREWYLSNLQKIKKSAKEYRDINRESLNNNRISRGRNKAYLKVHFAIKRGVLLNLQEWVIPCSDCNTKRATEYDHRDYNFPLLVDPVCHSCNKLRGVPIYAN